LITDAILTFFAIIVDSTVGLLPSSPSLGLNSDATAVVDGGFFNHLGWANNYFPVSDAVTAVGVLLALFAILNIARVALWVGEKFHLFGGSE
jgi:hypothetical protein